MSHFVGRMVDRALGLLPSVQPLIQPNFAATPEPVLALEDEIFAEPSQAPPSVQGNAAPRRAVRHEMAAPEAEASVTPSVPAAPYTAPRLLKEHASEPRALLAAPAIEERESRPIPVEKSEIDTAPAQTFARREVDLDVVPQSVKPREVREIHDAPRPISSVEVASRFEEQRSPLIDSREPLFQDESPALERARVNEVRAKTPALSAAKPTSNAPSIRTDSRREVSDAFDLDSVPQPITLNTSPRESPRVLQQPAPSLDLHQDCFVEDRATSKPETQAPDPVLEYARALHRELRSRTATPRPAEMITNQAEPANAETPSRAAAEKQPLHTASTSPISTSEPSFSDPTSSLRREASMARKPSSEPSRTAPSPSAATPASSTTESAPPAIRISIGRIEVRTQSASAPAASPVAAARTLGLEDYLKRQGGSSS